MSEALASSFARSRPVNATRPNALFIDLDALARNVREVRRLAGRPIVIMASVKANAYGHGIVPVARRLAAERVEVLATGAFTDAVAMREAGIATPILMMGGALPEAVPALVARGLMPTVHNPELAEAAAAVAASATRAVAVKVDCGLGRLGVPLDGAHAFVLALARRPRVEVAGLYTHLPFSDTAGADWARDGVARFGALVAALARDGVHIPVTQARASSALLAGIDDDCTAVSPGALLYGLAPVDAAVARAAALRPVMVSLRTRLIQISRHTARVGRHAGRVTGPTGVVPFGRLDGNRMSRPDSGAHMLVAGRRAPILGVSLEHCVLDLSLVPEARIGDEVVVLGGDGDQRISLDDIARWQGGGVNDVLMSLNGRLEPTYTAEQAPRQSGH